MHDDPLPRIQEQLATLQAAGRQSEAGDLMVKLANENSKRERWAVSDNLIVFYLTRLG